MADDRFATRPEADFEAELEAVRISAELQSQLDRLEQIEAECDELVRAMRTVSDRPPQSGAARARARS